VLDEARTEGLGSMPRRRLLSRLKPRPTVSSNATQVGIAGHAIVFPVVCLLVVLLFTRTDEPLSF